MTTELISRLERGRWDGDNAEVLKALGCLTDPGFYPPGEVPEFPKPLDDMNAALRLVPEGWHTTHTYEDSRGGKWWWQISSKITGQGASGRAPTAAIALCIAILKAKESDHV